MSNRADSQQRYSTVKEWKGATRLCMPCGLSEQDAGRRFAVCGRCESARYGSGKCQVLHWQVHKPICKTICEVKSGPVKSEFELSRQIEPVNLSADLIKWHAEFAPIITQIAIAASDIWPVHAGFNICRKYIIIQLEPRFPSTLVDRKTKDMFDLKGHLWRDVAELGGQARKHFEGAVREMQELPRPGQTELVGMGFSVILCPGAVPMITGSGIEAVPNMREWKQTPIAPERWVSALETAMKEGLHTVLSIMNKSAFDPEIVGGATAGVGPR